MADLAAIGLCLIGALLALALYRPGSAGLVGSFLVHFVRFWMGHGVHVAPLLFLAAGTTLALDARRATNAQMLLGALLALAVLFGWMHLSTTRHAAVFDTTAARLAAMFGRPQPVEVLRTPDGGLLGAVVMALMFPLGRAGSYVTLVAMGAAALLLISELTIRGIVEHLHERSRRAAERARARAAERRERRAARQAEAAANLPVPVDRNGRQRPLFLEVGPSRPADAPGARPAADAPAASKARLRALFRRKAPEREPEAGPEAAAPGSPVESSVEPAAGPAPEPSEASSAECAPARRAEGGRAARARRAAAERPAGECDPQSYVLPPFDLLDSPPPRPRRSAAGHPAEADANIAILEGTLAQFRIEAQVVEIADGPSVTRYEIRLGEGIRVKKIIDLADNIAMSLAAMSVRVEAPIPGKSAIGIEVPKKHPQVVTLRECLESEEFRQLQSTVGFVLGKDVAGKVRCADLAKMPHLLVAGATNSGKSVCLNVLIASMLFRARPDELKMIMIDPKRVELTLFEGIPHLVHPVVKDVKQAAGILRWVLKEMDRRYDLFAHVMTRNIDGYNAKVEPEKRLPFLVVIIDELADLMMQQGPEVEQSICRLAQLARATGIHLVIATQRPSVDVITGLIKANIPSRISFAVTSQVDSRTILDAKGAESLVGKGDMLFKPVDAAKPLRIQGAFLREGEVEQLVRFLKQQGRPEYIAEPLSVDHGAYGQASEEEAEDDLFEPAARFVVTTGHASTSMIQRKFKIGYTRAARLVDMMEARGIVGALDGAKPREILMSRDALDRMFLETRRSTHAAAYAEAQPFDDEAGEWETEREGEAAEPDEGRPAEPDPFVDEP